MAVTMAARELLTEGQPEYSIMRRRSIARIALMSEHLSSLEKFRLLTVLKDWETLDRLLATKLHLLAAVPKRMLAQFVLWPKQVPTRLKYLSYARKFVDGQLKPEGLSPGIPAIVADMVALLVGEELPAPGSPMEMVRSALLSGSLQRAHQREFAIEASLQLMAFLEAAGASAENGTSSEHADFAVTLTILCISTCDIAIWLGLIDEAHQLAQRAFQLSQKFGLHPTYAESLRASAKARWGFISAFSGQHDVARGRLAAYDELVTAIGPVDSDAPLLVRIARLYLGAACPNAQEGLPGNANQEGLFPAFEVQAEGLRAVVSRGDSGISWLRTAAGQLKWALWPEWVWWPVYSLMALLEVREGRVASGRAWAGSRCRCPASWRRSSTP